MSFDTRTSELAATWAGRLQKGELAQEEAATLESWLLADPAHQRAFSEACYIFAVVGDLSARRRAEILAPIQEQFAEKQPAEEPSAEEQPAEEQSVDAPTRWRVYALAASVAFATVLGLLWLAAAQEGWLPHTYRTATGETRIVQLPDGSEVHLNARTTLRWLGLLGERRTQLLAGEALFQVVHDRARPFYVEIDGAFVRVVGTQFDLNRLSGATVLTVLEGAVVVSNSARPVNAAWTRNVSTGERLAFGRAGVIEDARSVDASKAVRWLDSSLELEKEPLSTVVEELSRYTDQPITFGNDALKTHRVVGTLDVRDVREALHDLEAIAPVAVRQDGAGFVLDLRTRTTP